MADLIHRFTEQLVTNVDKEHFLANVADAVNWIEAEALAGVHALEAAFSPEQASAMPAVETVDYGDGVTATGVAPLPEASPEQPALDVPAEAAAIAAEPEQN
jgi:hypothetical protein